MTRFIFLPDTDLLPATSESSADVAAHDAAREIQWIAVGTSTTSGESVPSAIPVADRTVAVIPISRIAFIDAMLPRVSAPRRRQLLNFAIEDKLTIDPETVHAVEIGQADTGPNRFVVAAIDRAWLTRAIAWLTARNLVPDLAVPETALRAVAQGEWLVNLSGPRGFAVRPDGLAYGIDFDATELATPPFALSLALNETAASADSRALPSRITIVAAAEVAPRIEGGQWESALGAASKAGMKITLKPATGASVTAQDATLAASNFLVGRFTPKSNENNSLAAFKWAAGLACISVLVHLLGMGVDAWRVGAQRRSIEGQLRQVFLQSFPEATAVVDAPLQMSRNLERLRRERGIAQDEMLAKLALAAGMTRDINRNITTIKTSGETLNVALTGLAADANASLRASAARQAGVNVTESAGTTTLSIGTGSTP